MTTTLTTLAVATAISERVTDRTNEINDTIRRYEGYIAAEREQLTKVESEVIELFEVKVRLEAAGFSPTISSWNNTLRLEIDKKQLTAAYGILGRFDGRNAVKEIEDPAKRLVRVILTPVKFPLVSVSYVAKLPRRGGRCRIETVRVKARTEKRLVCEM